jgi:hypothetical protein
MRAPVIVIVAVACGSSSSSAVGPVRFDNAPPVWRVNDRVDVPEPPREIPHYKYFYHYDAYYQIAKRALALTRNQRARAVNALDEVPDSTWFTNRIGTRPLSPDEIRQGPPGESPERHLPWTIESSKEAGTAVGFVVADSRGVRFLLKFDRPHSPEVETGGAAVVSRLLWACGFNVPSEHVVYFRRTDLRLAPDAYVYVYGEKRRLDDAYVDGELAKVASGRDPTIRGLASILIEGTPLGGAPRSGVRQDDPNDRVPHELRRDLRGLRSIAAWLAHNDLKEDNTLDVWQRDPSRPDVRYVVHYLLDFGKALGGMARTNNRWTSDYVYNFDPAEWSASLFTFGAHRQPWEGRPDPQIRGIGVFGASHYDPGGWKPNNLAALPIYYADRFDQFWGAKILVELTREHIAAAVEMGRYSDPRAAPYLVDTLVARQRKTARYWFRRVNPIDDAAIEHGRLCFTDLALRHHLETTPTTFHVWFFDHAGRAIESRKAIPDRHGRACLADFSLAGSDATRYTIARVDSSRQLPATLVHIAPGADGQPRVIGIHRL